MPWYQIAGWVLVPVGALLAWPGVRKLIAGRKSWQMPAALLRSDAWTGLFLVSVGLDLATRALWAEIANGVLLAAFFVLWLSSGVQKLQALRK
jgi:hypothetical protein